ncbi:pre-mRNA-splicing factor CWC22-like protein [Micractinium conductrix]|uniref:Pre-mRNA-splicing factor CWC22-like protein n=1 Tax=Micractinium conductrix TaxID=554055 RepID=A0A2P6VI67_9CHLO|nr:pre-mRNA-splicing factor CWC22-like protein [Micractinium conductrix]|eukprot:PSC73785.1 pre-mRNA-splicing factor CWC22-like protein [Micractinium conductrix]
MAEAADKESAQYQRMTWDALRKSINGLVNKVNAANIKHILPEVFSENLIRGKGLFCRSIMKSQMASPAFTPVYAALLAVVNTKFPELGELLLHRVVTQFKRAYRRNDKPVCMAAIKFIGHLANQQVVHELLPLEVLLLLLETPSDDGVEVAVDFLKEVGPLLEDLAPQGLSSIMDRLRTIMSEGQGVEKRTQFLIEALFGLRKAKWSGKVPVDPELEMVETEDQITHEISLEDKLDPQMHLDVFKEDPDFRVHEEEYTAIKREILGEESEEEDSEEERGEGESSSSEEEEEEGSEDEQQAEQRQRIQDETQTNLVNLRRTIYLTIMSALDFEEAGHKLLKMGIPAGQEMELATMIIECCSNEKTFIKYYALLGERFCKLKREFADCFSECFVRQYQLIHRLETNKLRNTAKLFAHLLSTDAIPWAVLQVMRLTEEDTTSSSRIFIKILFQELAETLGLVSLNKRLADPTCQDWFDGIFPKDSPRNMRFAINFFTSIGLGGLTDRMREMLKTLPKVLAAQQAAAAAAQGGSDSSSSSDSDSSSSDSSSSSSDSDSSSSDSSSGDSSSSSDSSSSESEDEGKAAAAAARPGGGERRRTPPPAGDRRRPSPPPRRADGAANGRPGSAEQRQRDERRAPEERRREERRERRDSVERARERRP